VTTDHWEAISQDIDNELLIALFAGFHSMTTRSALLEWARDLVRHILQMYNPSQMKFG